MANITVRYFQVTLPEGSYISFSTALKKIAEESLDKREKLLDGVNFRLERYEETNTNTLKGEMTRIQTDDFPSEVVSSGLEKLKAGKLGYGMAFVYDESLSVIALQYNNRVVSLSKFNSYLSAMYNGCNFQFLAIPGPDAWNDFLNSEVKRFKVKIALPQTLEADVDDPLGKSMSELAQLYNSPYVTVEIGTGRKKMYLKDAIKDTASRLINSITVESMKAKTVDMVEEIDLLEQMLRDRCEFIVPADPDESYKSRSEFVEKSMVSRSSYLAKYNEQ